MLCWSKWSLQFEKWSEDRKSRHPIFVRPKWIYDLVCRDPWQYMFRNLVFNPINVILFKSAFSFYLFICAEIRYISVMFHLNAYWPVENAGPLIVVRKFHFFPSPQKMIKRWITSSHIRHRKLSRETHMLRCNAMQCILIDSFAVDENSAHNYFM